MNIERKHIRQYLKKSLKSDFEKILYEAKMTADEEEIIRCICCKGMSKVQTAMTLQQQQPNNGTRKELFQK